MTPEFIKLIQDTSLKKVEDLKLTEVSQGVYEEAYEWLQKKYGYVMGRTNIMVNGHLITPILEQAMAAKARIVSDAKPVKELESKRAPVLMEQKK